MDNTIIEGERADNGRSGSEVLIKRDMAFALRRPADILSILMWLTVGPRRARRQHPVIPGLLDSYLHGIIGVLAHRRCGRPQANFLVLCLPTPDVQDSYTNFSTSSHAERRRRRMGLISLQQAGSSGSRGDRAELEYWRDPLISESALIRGLASMLTRRITLPAPESLIAHLTALHKALVCILYYKDYRLRQSNVLDWLSLH